MAGGDDKGYRLMMGVVMDDYSLIHNVLFCLLMVMILIDSWYVIMSGGDW